MDVGAVDHTVGVAEALAEGLAHLDAADLAAVDSVHHGQVVGEHRAVARSLAGAEGVKRRVGIRAELDAGADLADLRGLLQQQHADALLGQHLGSGQTADAATDDDHRLLFLWCTHDCLFSIVGNTPPRTGTGVARSLHRRAGTGGFKQ
ncbi:hypothetical protein D9M71_723450 [compost metagenome]